MAQNSYFPLEMIILVHFFEYIHGVLTHYQARVPLGRVIWAFALAIFQGSGVEGKIVGILKTHRESHTQNEKHRWLVVSMYYDPHGRAASSVCP